MDTDARGGARTQAIFRAGNEALERNLRRGDGVVPFLCECGDETCLERVSAERAVYEGVRRDPRRFLVLPGHGSAGDDDFRVVGGGDGYDVIEKLDEAAEIAEATDPRASRADG